MSRLSNRRPTGDASTSAAPTASTNALKLGKAGLYDLSQIKRTLDDEVVSFLEDRGYAQVTWTTDLKIVLGSAAVAVAMYSHFNKIEFPDNRTIVIGCVLIYGLCTAFIHAVTYFEEKNCFFVGMPTRRARTMGRGGLSKVMAYSSFAKQGQSTYVLKLLTPSKMAVSKPMPYEKFFTTEGEFLASVYREDLDSLLKSFGKKSQ